MKSEPLTGRTTFSGEECCRLFSHCKCNYELWRGAKCVASCTTRETFEAAKRLLGP